jgi:uncharacterized protein YbjT (DUF2867 family)
VRALTRRPDQPAAVALAAAGAVVVQGDLDDAASVGRALAGVYGVFGVQNFWETGYDREVRQGVALAEAAQAAGVQHFVYASVASAHRHTGLKHFESKILIEQRIQELGLPHTIFRPVWFMENWEGPYLKPALLDGTLAMPLDPDVNFQQVTVADVGAFAALAFENPEYWLGRAVDLAGDERSVGEVAEVLGRVLGREVAYQQVPWENYRNAAGDEYHDMFRWFQDVGYDADIPALLGEYPQLTDFEGWLHLAGWEEASLAGTTAG